MGGRQAGRRRHRVGRSASPSPAGPAWSPASRAPTAAGRRCWCTATSTSCPADPAEWSVHPFSGEERDGYVWGRGAVDMKDMDAMVLALVRDWARTGVQAAARHRAGLRRRRGGRRQARRPLAGRRAPRPVRGLHRGDQRGRRLQHHRPRRPAPLPRADRGEGPGLDAADRRRPARPRLVRARRQRRHPAVRGGRPARLGTGCPPCSPRRCASSSPRSRTPTASRSTPTSPEQALARLGSISRMIGAALRNTANPTMLDAGYKANVIPGTRQRDRRRPLPLRPAGGVRAPARRAHRRGHPARVARARPGRGDDVRRAAGRRDGRRAQGRGRRRARRCRSR